MNLNVLARSSGVVLAAVVTVVPLVTAVSCQGKAKACNVSFDGLHVAAGQVVDVARPVCDVPPQTHFAKVAIEFLAGEWIELGRPVSVSKIPDATGSFGIDVAAPCQEGRYRITYRAEGTGPDGIPFSFSTTGPEVDFTLVDCAS